LAAWSLPAPLPLALGAGALGGTPGALAEDCAPAPPTRDEAAALAPEPPTELPALAVLPAALDAG